MTLIAHATDGLISAGVLGWTGVDASRFYMVLIAVWCVTALFVVIRYGTNMGRKPVTQIETAPVGQPLTVK